MTDSSYRRDTLAPTETAAQYQARRAEVTLHAYVSGRPFYLAQCDACLWILNSGHHYAAHSDAQGECDRHNATVHA